MFRGINLNTISLKRPPEHISNFCVIQMLHIKAKQKIESGRYHFNFEMNREKTIKFKLFLS